MGLKDQLWKGIIEEFAEDFIRFFFPDHVDYILFDQGFEYLDKELKRIVPKPAKGERRADLLIKGKMKEKGNFGFLIHTEVQGYGDPDFGMRVFESAYRIRDRYKIPTTTLVIYTDEHPKNHTSSFKENFMGTEFFYQFNTFSLIKNPPAKWADTPNLFSIVLASAWQALKKGEWTDSMLLAEKMKLIRKLFDQGLSKNKIEKLLDFIQFYVPFEKEENNVRLKREIFNFQEIQHAMGIRERLLEEFKRQGHLEGHEKGLLEGLEKGHEEGLEKGLEKGRVEGIKNNQVMTATKMLQSDAFQKGFISLQYISDITGLSLEHILTLKEALETNS